MHVRSLLAGVGLAAVVVAVPLVVVSTASAGNGADPAAASCPRLEIREAIGAFRTAHPEVASERTTIRALPPGQRADAWRHYLADHPDVAADVRALRTELRGQRWEAAGNLAAAVAAHPELAGLRDALADAQPGQREAAGQAYLTAHPEARAALRQLRQENRARLDACRAGD